jgi:hypothetical protein
MKPLDPARWIGRGRLATPVSQHRLTAYLFHYLFPLWRHAASNRRRRAARGIAVMDITAIEVSPGAPGAAVLARADATVAGPMPGMVNALNVATSNAVVLYHPSLASRRYAGQDD